MRSAMAFRSRGPNRTEQRLDPKCFRTLNEVTAINAIAVADKIARLAGPASRLNQLTPDPGRGGVGGHIEVDEFAPVVRDEEEHVERLERQGVDGQQVSCPDPRAMVGQERTPGLSWGQDRPAPAVAPDGAIADDKPELEEFSSDTLLSLIHI